MELVTALVLDFLLWLLFLLMAYYGMRSTLWSSLVFSVMIAVALLIFFVPPTQLPLTEPPTPAIIWYYICLAIAFILVVTYVFVMAVFDTRKYCRRACPTPCPAPRLQCVEEVRSCRRRVRLPRKPVGCETQTIIYR